MIYELAKEEFSKVRPLFIELEYNLVVDSILNNNTMGRVFVDHNEEPKKALIWNLLDTVLIAGNPDDEEFNHSLQKLLTEDMIPDAKKYYIPCFNFYLSPTGWKEQFDIILAGHETQVKERIAFHLAKPKSSIRVPEPLVLEKIGREELAQKNLENFHQAYGWIRSFWPGDNEFLEKGMGYWLRQGDTILSWALSVYVHDNRYELGLATAEAHRKRGYAKIVAGACINECLERGLIPEWHCDLENIPSVRLADKLGYLPCKEYQVYCLEF